MKTLCAVLAFLVAVVAVHAASMEMTSARLYKKQGELEKSLQYYDAELQKNPTNPEALFERGELLGEIAMAPGQAELAGKLAADASHPQRNLLERMLSDFEKAKTNADEKVAKKLTKRVSDIISENWNTFYISAVHEDSMKAYDKAIEQADLAILLMPGDWRAHGLKAQVLDRLEKASEALDSWESAYQNLRVSNWEKERPKEYRQAMDIIHGRLLEGYYNEGESASARARDVLDTAYSNQQRDSLNAVAVTAFLKTIEFADEVLKTNPDNGDAIQFKAFALAQLASNNRYSEKQRDSLRAVAVKALDEAQKRRPDYAPIVYTKAQYCLQLEDTTGALKEFNTYLEMEPKDRDARFVIGVLYLEGGSFINTEQARDAFKTLTEQYPEDAAAWTNYGVSLIRLGDNAGGKAAIEKAKSLGGH